MREIKFRIFCCVDGENQMVVLTNGEFDNGYWFSCPSNVSHIDEHLSPLMQYTGLKDKIGKEIYEGDIIQTSYGKVGTVVYYETSASFIVNDPNHFNEQLWEDVIYSEVIGNIYETPELIK